MGWILLCAVGLWLIGARMGISRLARGILLVCGYLGILLLLLVSPDGTPIRAALGGGTRAWLILGGVAGVVLLYRMGLRALRKRAVSKTDAGGMAQMPLFSDAELSRYSRHIMLREIGGPGQKALKESRVLVIGAGGLGSPVLLYLAAAGVGTIGVIDADVVEASNLQRQVIHADADIGQPKVRSAFDSIRAQNPFVNVRPYHRRLAEENAADLFADYDIIVDGSDNFETRYLSNVAAVGAGKPLVSGALSQWEGQVSVFHPADGTPCYECIFPQAPAPGLAPSCAEAGVLSPLPGVIGTIMATEVVKLVTGAGQPLLGQMLIYDALWGETRKIALKPRPDCPVCGAHHEVTA